MHMSKKTVAILLLSLLTFGSTIFLFVRNLEKRDAPEPQGPIATTTSENPFPESSSHVTIQGKGENRIRVNNFLRSDAAEKIDGVEYPLYELEDTSEENDLFSVNYAADYSYFNIVLYGEDLKNSREQAERFLSSLLGISEYNLCFLNYSVGVTISTNEELARYQNLGFSQCPGSITL